MNPDFETDRLTAGLRERAVRGGAVTVISQLARSGLQMASMMVLARLLLPQDFGLMAMVTAITGFLAVFTDLGLSMATIQRPEISHVQLSTLFWVNAALGAGVMLVTVATAPAIAWFYGEPRLAWIALTLSGAFLVSGIAVQHQALLRRHMRFGVLAWIEISAVAAGAAAGVGSAWSGAGYWALVVMQLAVAAVATAGAWLMYRWRPGRPAPGADVRSMLAFGRNLTGFNLLNYLARHLDDILIGRVWGAQSLGVYDVAYRMLLLPIQQISTPVAGVAIPILSRITDAPARYRHAYLRILEKIAIVTMPGVAFMVASSDWLVAIVLGPRWTEAGTIFAFLGIAAFTQSISNTTGWLFITQARTRDMFRWALIGETIAGLAILIGLPWGAVGVAAVYGLTEALIRTPLLYWYVGRKGPVQAHDIYRTVAPAAVASLCALLAVFGIRSWVEIPSPHIGLAVSFSLTAGVVLVVLSALPSGRLALRDFRGSLALLKPR